jgi:hypothetical protein
MRPRRPNHPRSDGVELENASLIARTSCAKTVAVNEIVPPWFSPKADIQSR